MPNYVVKCKECGKKFEAFASIKDMDDIKCDCGGNIEHIIVPGSVVGIHVWIPYLEENITHQPVMVNSKKHLKQLCKEHNLDSHRLD